MKIDISSLINKNKNAFKRYLTVTITTIIIIITSIFLFIFTSNYRIELTMQIVGSVVNSLLVIFLIFWIVAFLLPSLQEKNFLKELSREKEKEVVGTIENISEEVFTIRKGVLFNRISIDSRDFYSCFEEINNLLSTKKEGTYYIRGSFVVGVSYEKK